MKSFLIDGSLLDAISRKKAMIERMADDLIRERAYADDRDAMRLLYHLGYGNLNVPLLVKEARDLAMRKIVTREMSES